LKNKNYCICILLFFITTYNASVFGKEHIILRSKPHGMFSMFHFVLYFLQEYERNTIDGFEVNFANTGLYYKESAGPNWWEYYFEPIKLGNQNEYSSINIIEENVYVDPNSIEFCNSLEENYNLVQKYITVKDHILQKVEAFQRQIFEDKFIIGVHYRGTDKLFREAPFVAYGNVVESVHKVISLIPLGMDYKIFIATDEMPFLQFMQYQFLDKVCYCEIKRATDGMPLHLDLGRDPYQVGEGAIIDAIILSRVNFLIRTSSNLSLCSRYFNPKLPVIELSQRQETFSCTEFHP